MTPRILILAACLCLTGCTVFRLPGGDASQPINAPAALKEATSAKAAADAGSTVGVATAIRDSATLSSITASAQAATGPTAGEKVASGLVTAGRALADQGTVAIVGAGIQAGAGVAGVSDPSKMAVMGQAAAVGLGGLLTVIGAGLGAWLHRKGATPPPSS